MTCRISIVARLEVLVKKKGNPECVVGSWGTSAFKILIMKGGKVFSLESIKVVSWSMCNSKLYEPESLKPRLAKIKVEMVRKYMRQSLKHRIKLYFCTIYI